MIRVVVAEDHALVRHGMALLLCATGRHVVVAETGRGEGLEDIVASHDPDVLLLDLALSDSSGLEAARRVRQAAPRTRILIVTGSGYPGAMAHAFAAGAHGFVIKNAGPDELLHAIDTVLAGRRYVDANVPALVAANAAQSPTLTPREQEIVRMIARGASNQQIADALHISVLTARKHRQNIMAKLDLHNGAEVARYAVQVGLVDGSGTPG